jgi:hypothetical protein
MKEAATDCPPLASTAWQVYLLIYTSGSLRFIRPMTTGDDGKGPALPLLTDAVRDDLIMASLICRLAVTGRKKRKRLRRALDLLLAPDEEESAAQAVGLAHVAAAFKAAKRVAKILRAEARQAKA